MKLCPAPVTRSLVAPRTSAASSSSLCGRATCPFAVTLPDQLLHAICLAPASGLKAFAGEKVSQDYILSAEGQRTTKHDIRSEENTSELQSLMRISYAVFCLQNKKNKQSIPTSKSY